MQLSTSLHETESVLAVTGRVDAVDVPLLRLQLLDLLDRRQSDVLLDLRMASSVHDLVMPVLTVARSRAEYLRQRIVAVDSNQGAMSQVLRRYPMHLRIPVYPDLERAVAGLAADRSARTRLSVSAAAVPVTSLARPEL